MMDNTCVKYFTVSTITPEKMIKSMSISDVISFSCVCEVNIKSRPGHSQTSIFYKSHNIINMSSISTEVRIKITRYEHLRLDLLSFEYDWDPCVSTEDILKKGSGSSDNISPLFAPQDFMLS